MSLLDKLKGKEPAPDDDTPVTASASVVETTALIPEPIPDEEAEATPEPQVIAATVTPMSAAEISRFCNDEGLSHLTPLYIERAMTSEQVTEAIGNVVTIRDVCERAGMSSEFNRLSVGTVDAARNEAMEFMIAKQSDSGQVNAIPSEDLSGDKGWGVAFAKSFSNDLPGVVEGNHGWDTQMAKSQSQLQH